MKHEARRGRSARAGGAGLLVDLVRLVSLAGLIGLGGCTGARERTMSTGDLLDAVRARAGDLRTRISYAERRADALKTRVKASRRLADEVRACLRSADVRVSSRGAAVVVRVAGRLLFGPGDIELRCEARKELDGVALALRKTRLAERPVSIEGHTDASKPSRTAEDYATNWELSAARAVAVARYLVEACGLAPERVSVAAYGDTRPVAPNDTKEGRAENRRVEVVLLPPIETTRVSARIQ